MPMPQKPTPVKHCEYCGKQLERPRSKGGELMSRWQFERRKFCNIKCMARAFDERPQMSHEGASGERNVQSLRASAERAGLLREALPTVQEVGRPARFQAQSAHAVAVRRLTVEEVETLFGFPRGYTLIPYRGKPACDGPRYRALGNSMAVPLVQWLGRRIEMVSRL